MSGDIFLPALWHKDNIVAFSANGYTSKKWKLPSAWDKINNVKVSTISVEPIHDSIILPVEQGVITLALKPGEAVSITPVGK